MRISRHFQTFRQAQNLILPKSHFCDFLKPIRHCKLQFLAGLIGQNDVFEGGFPYICSEFGVSVTIVQADKLRLEALGGTKKLLAVGNYLGAGVFEGLVLGLVC